MSLFSTGEIQYDECLGIVVKCSYEVLNAVVWVVSAIQVLIYNVNSMIWLNDQENKHEEVHESGHINAAKF